MHRAVIAYGSNIRPDANVPAAEAAVSGAMRLVAASARVRTAPVGNADQPDFTNGAWLVETEMERGALEAWLHGVEAALGRERGADRCAPRTMDLDVVVWDGIVVHGDFAEKEFVRKAVLELLPGIGAGSQGFKAMKSDST
jgi:2-amino-4-hydroxy-6-hydroxymethyldihydropteridine diphosphokinase